MENRGYYVDRETRCDSKAVAVLGLPATAQYYTVGDLVVVHAVRAQCCNLRFGGMLP